jgi:hypothetical protein
VPDVQMITVPFGPCYVKSWFPRSSTGENGRRICSRYSTILGLQYFECRHVAEIQVVLRAVRKLELKMGSIFRSTCEKWNWKLEVASPEYEPGSSSFRS